MYKYEIVKEFRTTVVFCNGDIVLDDMKSLMKSFSKNPDFNLNHSILVDFRECTLKFDHNDLPQLFDFVRNDIKILASRKAAYLTSNPNEVVLTTLYSDIIKPHLIDTGIFTTSEAAINFLGAKGFSTDLLENIITELKAGINNLKTK